VSPQNKSAILVFEYVLGNPSMKGGICIIEIIISKIKNK